MVRRKIFSLGLIVLCLLLLAAFCVGFFRLDYAFGSQQKLANLTINAEWQQNGNLRVTEHWQVHYSKRDAPYWNHSLFISKTHATGVQDFTVYDTDYGREYRPAEQAGAFNATERTSYIQDSPNWYELGWNFPRIQAGERNFTISYTLTGVGTNYADTNELLYPFLSGSGTLPVSHLQLSLHFPGGGDIHTFVHCPEANNWEVTDARLLTLSADNLPAHTQLEVRLLLPPSSIEGSSFLSEVYILPQALAEEASSQGPNAMGRYRHLSVLLSFLGGALALGFVALMILRSERKIKVAFSAEVPLRREMPTCVRPAIMARLYYYEGPSEKGDGEEGYALSAATLSLLHKRWLLAAPCTEGQELQLTVQPQGQSPAEGEELILLEIYKALAAEKNGSFTLTDLENYKKSYPARAEKSLASFNEAVRRRFTRLGWARPLRFFTSPLGWSALACLVLALLFLLFGHFVGKPALVAGLLLAALFAGFYAGFRLRLTSKGHAELTAWRGFSKYLREYSLLCEDPQTEICLWGDYMVYASAFGFSKTLAAELALLYTQLGQQPPPNPTCEWPPPNPFPQYFGTEADPTDKALWPCTFGISHIARAFRLWRGDANQNQKSLRARFHRRLARLRKRFGLQ